MENDEAIKIWFETFLDECPDGTMEKEQFIKLYNATFKHHGRSAEKLAKFAFAYFDDEHNGRISIGDFVRSTSLSLKSNATSDQRIERLGLVFDALDLSFTLN